MTPESPRPALDRRLGNGSLQHSGIGALAGSFVLVERHIRALQEFLRGFTDFVVGPAAGEVQPDFVAGEIKLETFQAAENVTNFVRAAFWKDGHEFIAAQADRKIGAANGALQAIGETFQQRVAGSMAVIVIDLFQAVYIHQQNGEGAGVALRATDFLREALLAGAAVVESRELIESREFVNLRSERFHFGQGFDLVGDLVVQAHDLSLLIDQINAEDQDQPYERAHCLIQEEGIRSIVVTEHRGKRKRCYAEREKQNHGNRGGPQPPLATIEMLEAFADFFGLEVRAGKMFRLGNGIGFGHRISGTSARPKDARAATATLYVTFAGFPSE